MAQPQYYPDWATTTINLPGTGRVNKVRPRKDIRDFGMDYSQIMTCEEVNWWFNNTGQWIRYFQDEVLPTLPNTYLPRTGTKVSLSGDATGTATFNNSNEIIIDTTVVDNSHQHVSADISDATSGAVPNTVARRDANADIAFNTVITSNLVVNSNIATVAGKNIIRSINNLPGDGTGNINIFPVLPGSIITWPGTIAPAGYLECNGQGYDVNSNPRLYSVLGTNTVPDMRGLFVRGWSNGSSTYDPDGQGRQIRSVQADSVIAHGHEIPVKSAYAPNSWIERRDGSNGPFVGTSTSGTFGGAETRPKNIAMMFIIKTDA